MLLRGFAVVALAAWFVVAGRGFAQTSYPPGEPLIGTSPLTAFRLSGGNATATQVDVTGQDFNRAWRIETRVDASPAWAIELKAPVTRAVERGDVALLRFVARAVATSDESGAAFLRLAVQKASPEWDKSHQGNNTIPNAWTEFFVPFTFGADYAANASEIAFGFGFKRQTIEFGGFDFVYYGKRVALASLPQTRPTYFGREASAPWRTAALARIEQIRKGDFTIEVVDAGGRPVPGATVRIEQRRSAFQFGSVLQMARVVSNTAENRLYRQKALELFNAGGPENDLKWPPWTGEWGAGYTKSQAIAGLTWMKNHGIHVRGHVLVWPGWNNLPASIRALRGTPQQNEIPSRALAHIADIVGATREVVDEWDVLNEPYVNHDLMDVFGPTIQVDWFRAARAAHATAPLYLNDYNNHDASLDAGHVAHFETTARYLRDQGAPIGGLGLQAHVSASPSPPANVIAVLDRYAALGLPVRITEFDVNTDDEELQADYTRDFLTAVFSHPTVVGFQMWGFWERAHWIPRAAMVRADFSEKPNARAYKSLVLDQWRTRASGTTDAQGTWRGRGFHGDYFVKVEQGGRTYEQVFALRTGVPAPRVRVPLAAPRLVNLSTRATAGAGDATLIPGFFIAGPAAKRVLIRGIGPGLAGFGVSGALARPELSLRGADGIAIVTNRGWDSGTETATLAATSSSVGAFALTAGSADCAIMATLMPGAYTAPITSLDGATGVALVETYEVDAGESAGLRNLSTRARVAAGAGVAITGMVIAGENARTLLVRAVGPGLAAFGVGGTLARPSLVVMSGTQALAANDSWEVSAEPAALVAAAERAGAFPLQPGRADAALVVTLPAGVWTIHVTGADGGAGIVLIEVYDPGP
ncbi:MAG: endo-1,4-beta-xylanase [Verrucomicrobia bacterium]|nr:endo-1,4-beta-xylanase [Verrucomicrobiota bacterium]